ncbi:MAG: Gfo/Idh/MocA family protein [Halobacteriaceae archaeon]
MEPISLGIVGCGAISDRYFEAGNAFDALDLRACADLEVERAESKAEEHGVPVACGPDDLYADDEVDVVVVLTPPAYHGDVALSALDAGKHVYTEKPLAPTREEGAAILERAEAAGLRVGAAPDTFLGTGLQTCRDVVEEGRIGDPVGAVAFWGNHGHEHWHPDPEGFYGPGGGPLFDMGPYYLTALVHLLGPVSAVAGATNALFEEREITSDPKAGKTIPVEVPTHETGVLKFENGATGTLLTSFDVWESELPGFEIYGTEGTLSVTNPNHFGGTPRVHAAEASDGEWEEVTVTREQPGQQRGLGLVDMARAIRSDWRQRASGDLAYHVLDVMQGLRDSSDGEEYVAASSSVERPDPLPDRFPEA